MPRAPTWIDGARNLDLRLCNLETGARNGRSESLAAANPLVSVVIAARDEARWIESTIRSVTDQTHRELEIIVIDDGSTDGTADIAEACGDSRLRVVRQPPRGACAARNAGLSLASGQLIQMLDGDDLLAPHKIGRQVARWKIEGDRHVYCGPYTRFSSNPRHGSRDPKPNWTDMSGHDWLVSCWLHGGMMAPHGWLTPAPLIRAAGPWDETVLQNQDGEYFSRVLLASDGVRFCPNAISHYRIGCKDSISRRRDYAARRSRFHATCLVARRLLESPEANADTRRACAIAMEELMLVNWVEHPEIAALARIEMDACGGASWTLPYRSPLFRWTSRLIGRPLACNFQHLISCETKRWRQPGPRRIDDVPESAPRFPGAESRDGTTHRRQGGSGTGP